MYLQLSNDAQTAALHPDGTVVGCNYFPTTGDGKRVTESAVLVLEGTAAAIRARVNAIELLLTEADENAGTMAPYGYVNHRPMNSGDILRSRLLGGFVRWSEEAIRRRLDDATPAVEVLVTWTRQDYWEGPETALAISSAEDSESTGGVDIYNNSAATWVQVAANRVAGTMPAAVRIRLINATGATVNSRFFYLNNNVFGAPTSLNPYLAGGSASWNAGSTHNSLLYTWTLSGADLGYAAGRYFRVLAGFTSISGGAWLRAGVYSSIGGVYKLLRATREVKSDNRELFDLGALPIPPGGYGVNNTGLAVALTVRAAGAGSAVLGFAQLAGADSVRRLFQDGYGIPNGAAIEDNGIDGGAYYVSGSSRYPIVRAYGEPLVVWPGRTQRIGVLFDEGGNFVTGRKLTVQMWYRARFRTV